MREPSTGAPSTPGLDLVLQTVSAARAGEPVPPFVVRRAELALRGESGAVGTALRRVLETAREVGVPEWAEGLARELVRAGGALEATEDHASARKLFELAADLSADCARTALHAGRAARRSGDPAAALAHYRRAASLEGDGPLTRLARIGEAMVSSRPERRLSKEIRRALRSGDSEAAGVGLEARALVRCETRRCGDAIRDLCVCALRYPDREDRARAARRVAELLAEQDDLEAAREALLLVHEIGTAEQKADAAAVLHRLSLALGDALGVRRWAPRATAPEGTAHAAPARPSGDAAHAASPPPTRRRVTLPLIREWRDAVVRTGGP